MDISSHNEHAISNVEIIHEPGNKHPKIRVISNDKEYCFYTNNKKKKIGAKVSQDIEDDATCNFI